MQAPSWPTFAEFVMNLGSDSSHSFGTSASLSVYTKSSKVHGSSRSGRNVTLAVIWRIMAWISCVISFWDLLWAFLSAITRAVFFLKNKNKKCVFWKRERKSADNVPLF